MLELKDDGTSNTLTGVQKDNYLIEPAIINRPHGFNSGSENLDTCPAITANGKWQDNNYVDMPPFRIRKLTPRELWRLMGIYDNDYNRAETVNSNSQLYKEA
jgi:DNA (cytosine-5)-methyltransferase 1